MKKIFLMGLIGMMGLMGLMGNAAQAQLTIPGTKVTFKLNSEDWRYLRTFELKEGGDIYLYCYVGEVITDNQGDTVLPQLRIYVVKNYDGDLYELVYERYEKQPYEPLWEFSHGDGLPASGRPEGLPVLHDLFQGQEDLRRVQARDDARHLRADGL